jgi:hypothetical protein
MDQGVQLIEIDRFGKMIIESGGLGAALILRWSIAAQRNEQGVCHAGLRAQAPGDLKSIEAGQPNIEYDHLRTKVLCRSERCGSIKCYAFLETYESEPERQALGGVDIVIHDQHS